MNRKQFISELISEAERNIFKNELIIKYKEKFPDESKADLESTKQFIQKDLSYVEFLKEELAKCE